MTEHETKLFDIYRFSDVSVKDKSLCPYIQVQPTTSVPHTASRHGSYHFGKSKVPITERFVCYLMRKGRNTGKKTLAIRALRNAFIIINVLTNSNPIQVLVDALTNCGPREESAKVGRGGAMKRTLRMSLLSDVLMYPFIF